VSPRKKVRTAKGLLGYLREALGVLKPPPKLTVSEWADANRQLSEEASAEPGRWNTDRAMYQRGVMDAANDPTVETVVFMASAQVGKTEMVNNLVGYTIDQDPAPMLVIQPTLEMAHTWSKDRLGPMLRDTPCLKNKVTEPRAKDSNNTILHKGFPGGNLDMVGANSPAGLASRPKKRVLADEIDRYEASAGGEGDPVDLAVRRTQTFHDRKIFLISTPTEDGISRIQAAYEESDQRHFFVPCPQCGQAQTLVWAQVKIPRDDKGAYLTADTYYECVHCKAQLGDADLREAVRNGNWVASKPFKGVAGFHINQIYSPWSSLAQIAAEFRAAKDSRNRERLKVWVNTVLGEVWRDKGEGVERDTLLKRREDYSPGKLPAGVLVLTSAADVQDTRIEVEVKGWGLQEEGWGVEKLVLPGDPAQPMVWEDLDRVLRRIYRSELGFDMPIATMAVDSGGHHTQQVYRWCKARALRRVWAIKGVGGPKQLIMRPSKDSATKALLLPLGVDQAKSTIYAQLKLTDAGPGYQHFPNGHGYDQDHFDQLTSEERHTKFELGVAHFFWRKKKSGARNEALDLAVYNYCILNYLRPNWSALKQAQEYKAAGAMPQTEQAEPQEEQLPQAPLEVREPESRPAPKGRWRKRGSGGGGFTNWQ
jgi:phage terminase large subunit GpA-like protein